MPEVLELEPVPELIPTASASTSVQVAHDENLKPDNSVVPDEITSSITTPFRTLKGSNKRKSQDELGSSSSSNAKKPRRISKLRSKRVKV